MNRTGTITNPREKKVKKRDIHLFEDNLISYDNLINGLDSEKMSKRRRDPIFTASEKNTLTELVAIHFNIVESKKTDNINIKMKNEEWKKIATEFNAISSIHPRGWDVLKKLWDNLKKRAKQSQTLRNQHFLGTGGGPPKNFIEDPTIEKVLELIQTRVTGYINSNDSDGTLVLASGQHGEGTSANVFSASENFEECSNDAIRGSQAENEEVLEIDWSQYTPSMLRVARNPALARPRSPLPDVQLAANAEEEMTDQQLSVTDAQLPVADPQLPIAEAQPTNTLQDHHQALSTPPRACTTRVTPAAMRAATTSRRRPVSRPERETQNLTTERLNTLLKCNMHAEEEHAMQMKILRLHEQREKEMFEQEKIKTQQEKVKLEILLKKLNE